MAVNSSLAVVTMRRTFVFAVLLLWITALSAQEARYPFNPATQQHLRSAYFHHYDLEQGGWLERGGKNLPIPSIAYALSHSPQDIRFNFIATQVLTAATALQDPQSGHWVSRSLTPDWQTRDPQTAGLLATAQALWLYATASRWAPQTYPHILAKTKAYLLSLRAESGAFSLPDTAPRALDTATAARALLALYALDGDTHLLALAEQSIRWAMAQHRLPSGGFSHPETGQLELDDTQAMALALFELHLATGLPNWLAEAEQTLNQVGEHLRDLRGGFIAAPESELRPWQGNLGIAQTASQLYHATHNMRYWALAEHALKFLAADFDPATCPSTRQNDLLYADHLLQQVPPRYLIIGHRDDPAALRLYQAALKLPLLHRRLEWWDRRETAATPDLNLPVLDHAAAYQCSPDCTPPLIQPGALTVALTPLPVTPAQQP